MDVVRPRLFMQSFFMQSWCLGNFIWGPHNIGGGDRRQADSEREEKGKEGQMRD